MTTGKGGLKFLFTMPYRDAAAGSSNGQTADSEDEYEYEYDENEVEVSLNPRIRSTVGNSRLTSFLDILCGS